MYPLLSSSLIIKKALDMYQCHEEKKAERVGNIKTKKTLIIKLVCGHNYLTAYDHLLIQNDLTGSIKAAV